MVIQPTGQHEEEKLNGGDVNHGGSLHHRPSAEPRGNLGRPLGHYGQLSRTGVGQLRIWSHYSKRKKRKKPHRKRSNCPMSFEFDDDDEVTRARFDRLAELLDVVRANTKEINKIAAEIREDTSRRTEYVRLLRAYREQRASEKQWP